MVPWENRERHVPQPLPMGGAPEVLMALCKKAQEKMTSMATFPTVKELRTLVVNRVFGGTKLLFAASAVKWAVFPSVARLAPRFAKYGATSPSRRAHSGMLSVPA